MKSRWLALCLALSLSTAGCAAFWQFIRSNPFGAVLEGVGYLQNATGLAELAFNAWAAANPDTSADARARFNEILGNVRRGISLAQSGMRVAAEARRDNVNPDALMREARDAVSSLTQFLQGLPQPPGRGAGPRGSLMSQAIEQCQQAASHPVLTP